MKFRVLDPTRQWVELNKIHVHLYHEVQCTFSVLGGKIFPLETFFYQPLMFEYQTGNEQNRPISNQKIVINDSFAHNLTCYHAQITIFFSYKLMI